MSELNFTIAPAVEATSAPPIPKAQSWAAAFSASSSRELLDLSQGVPRAAPHPSVLSALASTSSDPQSARYGPILGEPALRSAVAVELAAQYATTADEKLTPQDVAITTGCNMAFLLMIMVLCSPNDSSILLPLPAYFNQSMTLSLQSVQPLYIPCDPDASFKPSLAEARKYLERENGRVEPRAIVLVSPNNPTGTVMTHSDVKAWYDLATEFKVALVLDETYRDFVEGEDGERGRPHGLFEEDDWRGTLISLGSFSKGYRIPGHRLGSIIASPYLLQRIATLADCMQICPPRPPQLALAPLLPSLRPDLLASSTALIHRRRLFHATVDGIAGWKTVSSGGFFAYVQFPLEYKKTSEEVAKILASELGVITLPGSFFMPALEDPLWEELGDVGRLLKDDRWLRFAVANVEDETIEKLGPRLEEMNKLMEKGRW
ncbi:hypothetical protein P7C73_g919, partial [Tremellales sp. Uapishka_1]